MTKYLVNDQIIGNFIYLIDSDGSNRGEFQKKMAIQKAKDEGLDLVQISLGKNNIPVCKICDMGKLKYEESKQKIQKTPEIKEIMFKANIAKHDLDIKINKVKELLGKNHKIKFGVKLKKGREMEHADLAYNLLVSTLKDLEPITKYDPVKTTDNIIYTILVSK